MVYVLYLRDVRERVHLTLAGYGLNANQTLLKLWVLFIEFKGKIHWAYRS